MILTQAKYTEAVGLLSNISTRKTGGKEILDVTFIAEGRARFVKEPIGTKKVPVKIGSLTLWHKNVPILSGLEPGNKLTVIYETENPKNAYIAENREVTAGEKGGDK